MDTEGLKAKKVAAVSSKDTVYDECKDVYKRILGLLHSTQVDYSHVPCGSLIPLAVQQ